MGPDEMKSLIHRHLEGTGMFLVETRETPGKLTVYVDREEGINVSLCAALNRALRDAPELEEYTSRHEIEVSSPGPEVPLRDYRQFVSRIGKRLRVVLPDGSEWKGEMTGADASGFDIREVKGKKKRKQEGGERTRHFGYDEISEAHVEFVF